jgi:outer membrane protein OmpA-like peptidoglycan-associated protein
MTLRILAGGLVVALLASPAALAESVPGQIVVAQADTEVSRYLAEARPLASLSDQELKERIRIGRDLAKGGSLSKEDRKKVRTAMKAAAEELKGRGSANTAESKDTDSTADQQAQTADPAEKPEKKKKKKDTQVTASGGASEFLADTRPLDKLDISALEQKLKAGRDLAEGGSLAKADRKKVREVIKAVRAEIKKRGGKSGDDGDDIADAEGDETGKAEEQAAAKDTGKPAGDGSAATFLADNRPLDELSDKDLRQRMRTGRQLMKDSSLADADRKKVQQIVRATRLEVVKRGGKGGKKSTEEQAADAGQDAAADAKTAQAVADAGDAAKLDDQALRQRMKAARDSLKSGKLSAEESKALRQKLAVDRKELRQRVSKKSKGGQDAGGDQPAVDWLKDTREAKALDRSQLESRMAFYRARLDKGDLTPEQKAKYRLILDGDRQEFRARALVIKEDRVKKLKNRVASKDINIQINIVPPGPALAVGVPPPPVWAAEADDEMIVTQLVRQPARKFDRRYTFAEIAAEPELREAMPAVEIDTVTFGFNEDWVREEQLENLDRIGEILEEIVAAHPQEIFMIEGHTDAVGADDYNLDLSRRRAAAIKAALTEYYAIAPQNLDTVGFGERYLKIPTEEPEEENRRITIRRITPAVGELQG